MEEIDHARRIQTNMRRTISILPDIPLTCSRGVMLLSDHAPRVFTCAQQDTDWPEIRNIAGDAPQSREDGWNTHSERDDLESLCSSSSRLLRRRIRHM